ncbi:MAG: guanylate kinase [Actinobacteria bacterium]|nr:guanylate kinase [Actinomycetota bacterium]
MALLVVAGTSGAGKGTIVARLRQRHPGIWYSVSATTRPQRPGEENGREYLFLTTEDFVRLRDSGGLLEWFEVYGHLYGTPRGPVEEHLGAGDDVVLELDVQGALAVREVLPEATLLFIRAPSHEEQRRRLEGRGDRADTIEARMAVDEEYEARTGDFDHVIVNDDLDRAVDEVSAILEALRRRPA